MAAADARAEADAEARAAAEMAKAESTLPKTASSVPAVGLAGFALLALGGALTVARRLRSVR
jgi:LPXTG-motif cell wall-anchored protein